MSSILQTIAAIITPEMISGLGKQFGLSDELTRQGLVIANAVLVGGMARAAGTPEGAATVARLVEQADTGVLSNLVGVAARGPDDTARQLFGSNLDLVTGSVKKAAGIDIAPFLGLVAPVVLGVTKNIAGQQQLDAGGIAGALQNDVKSLARRDAATARVLKEVFKPLEAQDRLRAAFSAEEWAALQHAPQSAAGLIILADRSGRAGRTKEIEALHAAVAEAVSASGPGELVSLLFRDGISDGAVEGLVKAHRKTDEPELHATLLAPITEAVKVARAKAPRGDASAYHGLLIAVAQRVASAAKEGSFLGMGGTEVSDAEKEAIDALVAALTAA